MGYFGYESYCDDFGSQGGGSQDCGIGDATWCSYIYNIAYGLSTSGNGTCTGIGDAILDAIHSQALRVGSFSAAGLPSTWSSFTQMIWNDGERGGDGDSQPPGSYYVGWANVTYNIDAWNNPTAYGYSSQIEMLIKTTIHEGLNIQYLGEYDTDYSTDSSCYGYATYVN